MGFQPLFSTMNLPRWVLDVEADVVKNKLNEEIRKLEQNSEEAATKHRRAHMLQVIDQGETTFDAINSLLRSLYTETGFCLVWVSFDWIWQNNLSGGKNILDGKNWPKLLWDRGRWCGSHEGGDRRLSVERQWMAVSSVFICISVDERAMNWLNNLNGHRQSLFLKFPLLYSWISSY